MKKRDGLISSGFIIFLILLSCARVRADEWNGFRGLDKQGKSDSLQGPLQWSAEQNVLWKTEIPGAGHSSPVVTQKSVYLTTAYATEQGQQLISLGLWARFFPALFVIVASIFLLVKSSTRWLLPFRQIAGLSIFLSLSILLMGAILFDAHLFDYGRCEIRAWLGSSLIVNLCLIHSVFQFRKGSRERLIIGAIAILFAVIVAFGFPAREHAFRNGANQMIAIGAVVFPLITAMLILSGHFFFPADIADEELAVRKSSTAKNLLLVTGVSLAMLSAATFIVVRVVRSSEYLSYHITNLNFKPVLGVKSVYLLMVVCVAALAGFLIADKRLHKILDRILLKAYPYVILFTALVTFVGTNYLTTSNVLVRAIVSVDCESGHVNWICEGLDGPPGQMHRYNSPATPTPVTDGERVCAYFGTAGVMCADMKGKLLWTNSEQPFESVYGVGVSPVLVDGVIIIASGMPSAPYVSALDARTGRQLWRKEQPGNIGHIGGTSRTPLVHEVDGTKAVLVWGWDAFRGFDLQSGRELWEYPTPQANGDMVASIVADRDTVYLPYPGWVDALSLSKLMRGENPSVWNGVDGGANCSSPVLVDGLLFTMSDDGIAACLDARTGKLLWSETLDGDYYSSLIAVGKNIFFTSHQGQTTIAAAEPRFRKVAENNLGERITASLSPVDDKLFVRSENYLYCIQAKH
jgi:FOG: WD40-like repeat